MEKRDLTNKDDIKLLVDTFYDKVNQDELLAPVFNDFAGVDWEAHLPRMYNFWSTILFADGDYKGSPFDKHIPLPVDKTHFDRWLSLFIATIEELFEGETTESTKIRAQSIAHIFQTKLEYINSKK